MSVPLHPRDTTAIVCYQCGQTRHMRPDCPKCFDVHYMDLEERQGFTQEEFVALNVMETVEQAETVKQIVEEAQDFFQDNK